MDVKEIENERLKRKYEIVLPFQKIAELENEKLEEVRSTAHIRGFRPGKVPMSLIKKRFGDAVRSNVLDEHSKSVLDEFMNSKDETPVAGLNVALADREDENSDYVLTVDYECTPQIPDVDLSSIEIEQLVVDIDDDFIDQAVKEEMRQKPDYGSAPEGHAIQKGDSVALNYRAAPADEENLPEDEQSLLVVVDPDKVDEQSLFDAMKFDLVHPVLSRLVFDMYGISAHLIGMKVGDTAEIELDVPKAAIFSELSGKKARFNIEIRAIEMRLDYSSEEEFARMLEYDSAAAYRLQLMARLKHYYERLSKELLVGHLFWELNKKLDFNAPEAFIENEIDFQKRELGDAPPEDQESGMDESSSSEGDSDTSRAEADSSGETGEPETENEIRELAERRVKHFMFMEKLAKEHQISLRSQDFLDFVNNWAESETDRSSILKKVENDAEFRQRVLNMAITDKTTNFVVELVNVETKKVPPEDLIKIYTETTDVNLSTGLRYELSSG